jgi:hypothetical protein
MGFDVTNISFTGCFMRHQVKLQLRQSNSQLTTATLLVKYNTVVPYLQIRSRYEHHRIQCIYIVVEFT